MAYEGRYTGADKRSAFTSTPDAPACWASVGYAGNDLRGFSLTLRGLHVPGKTARIFFLAKEAPAWQAAVVAAARGTRAEFRARVIGVAGPKYGFAVLCAPSAAAAEAEWAAEQVRRSPEAKRAAVMALLQAEGCAVEAQPDGTIVGLRADGSARRWTKGAIGCICSHMRAGERTPCMLNDLAGDPAGSARS